MDDAKRFAVRKGSSRAVDSPLALFLYETVPFAKSCEPRATSLDSKPKYLISVRIGDAWKRSDLETMASAMIALTF